MTVTVECENCGEEMEKYPSRLERNDYFVCSTECEAAVKAERQAGENNPNYRGGPVEVTCETCGDDFEKERRNVERDERHFCSRECLGKFYGKVHGFQPGEKNPEWNAGATENPRYYGRNWPKQRQKALERDGFECVECGADEPLVVHHIQGRDSVDTTEPEWYVELNKVENLKTMCRSCHRKEHHERGDHEHTYGFGDE